MIANLIVKGETFSCRGNDRKEVIRKFKDFSKMVRFATSGKREGDNVFYIDKSQFMETEVFEGCSVEDIFNFTPKARELALNDLIGPLIECMKCFSRLPGKKVEEEAADQPEEDKEGKKEEEKFPPEESKDVRNAVCVMQHSDLFPIQDQIISNKTELGKFRRLHFIKYQDSDGYFEEVDKYMEGLVLHPDIKSCGEYKSVFKSHKVQIEKCLTELERHYYDDFKRFKENGGNSKDFPDQFASKYKCCDEGSFQGKDMSKYDCIFPDREGKVSIDPHMKMNFDDRGRAASMCRIYFEQPNHNLGKLYIGYICIHL